MTKAYPYIKISMHIIMENIVLVSYDVYFEDRVMFGWLPGQD